MILADTRHGLLSMYKKYIKIKIVGEITRDREDINCKWLFVSNLMVYHLQISYYF